VLTAADGSVSGILDWDGAREDGITSLDIVHLLLTTRSLTSRRPLGDCAVDLLSGASLTTAEAAVLRHASALDGPMAPDLVTLVRLAWLHHVLNNVEKAPRYRTHRLWVHANVESVLAWHLR
jgi:hypothetical protein